MSMLKRIMSVAAFILGTMLAQSAFSQPFPAKPIRVIVPYPPGGATDGLVRAIASAVSDSVGQQVIVDNRPGGNTFIGMSACAKAAPDGYTVCVTNSDSLSLSPFIFTKIPYDPASDLVGISNLADPTSGIFVSGEMPFSDFAGMVAYARANPGKLNFASFGAGTIGHLYVEWFNRQLKVQMTHVPYKGAAPIIPALMSNESQVAFLALGQVLGHIKSGKIKVVAIVGPRRSPAVPDAPTVVELNADAGPSVYFGLYAPTRTPAAVVERLNGAFTGALQNAKVREMLATLSFQPVGSTVMEINRAMKAELEAARNIVNLLGIKPMDAP